LYPTNGRRPSRERVLKECAAFFVGGTAYRGQPLRPAKRTSKTDGGHDAVDQVELARLREENERLRAECEVLKQSVAIWVREATGK
jgi:hypothetical protein